MNKIYLCSILTTVTIAYTFAQVPEGTEGIGRGEGREGAPKPTLSQLDYPKNTYQNQSDIIVISNKNNKKGVNKLGKEIVKPIYDEITISSLQHFIVKKDNKYGLLDKDAKIIIPVDKENIKTLGKENIFVIKNFDQTMGLYFANEKNLTPFIYQSVKEIHYGANILIKQNNKYGLMNTKGELIVPIIFDNINEKIGNSYVIKKDNKYGLLNMENNNFSTPTIYDEIKPLDSAISFGLATVSLNEKYGIISSYSKNTLIPVKYDYIYAPIYNKPLIITILDKKVGVYNINGKEISPPLYDELKTFKYYDRFNGTPIAYFLKKDNLYSFLTNDAQIVNKDQFTKLNLIHDTSNDLNIPSSSRRYILVKNKHNLAGLFDFVNGKLIVPTEYDEITQQYYGRDTINTINYIAKKKNTFGILNNRNETVIPFDYSYLSFDNIDDKEQFVAARKSKFGVINLKNEIIIPFSYKDLKKISYNNLYKAKKDKLYQIINQNNKPINPDFFDEVTEFEKTYRSIREYKSHDPEYIALTFRDGKMRVINHSGEFITSPIEMKPHNGYKRFEDLKIGLISALNNPDEKELREFVEKISPSEHIIFFLDQYPNSLANLNLNIEQIKEETFQNLLFLKHNSNNKNYEILFKDFDLTEFNSNTGFQMNYRINDPSYGNENYLEKLLRKSIKVNGYWISTYFMHIIGKNF